MFPASLLFLMSPIFDSILFIIEFITTRRLSGKRRAGMLH